MSSASSIPLIGSSEPQLESAQPEKPIEKIPSEVWGNVFSFLTYWDRCSVAETCKALNIVHQNKLEGQIEGYPLFKYLIDHSGELNGSLSPKQKIAVLHDYTQYAQEFIVGDDIFGGSENLIHRRFRDKTIDLRSHIEQNRAAVAIDRKNPVKGLIAEGNNLHIHDLFLAAIARGDEKLVQSIDLELVHQARIDYAAYLYLLRGKRDRFLDLLPYTSTDKPSVLQLIWNGNRFVNSPCFDVLETFLALAAEKGHLSTFKHLLETGKPFSPDELLVTLVNLNCGEAIRLLLTSREVNGTFLENEFDEQTPGLHTALRIAATKPSEAALNAILEAKPGEAIDFRILKDVKERFEDANHPNRVRIEQEIATRYPYANLEPLLTPMAVEEQGVLLEPERAVNVNPEREFNYKDLLIGIIIGAITEMVIKRVPKSPEEIFYPIVSIMISSFLAAMTAPMIIKAILNYRQFRN